MTNSRIAKAALFVTAFLASAAFCAAQTQASPSQTQPSSSQPSSSQTQPGSSAGLQVNPSQVQKKANTPPSGATSKTSSVGQKVQVATPPDSESWAEQLDVDGNGTAEQTNLVWDSADKVMLSDSTGTFTCSNGATGTGELLVAVNGAGNTRGRPAGSGFWVATMDKGDCGIPVGSMWGCKFDASGTATTCGVATVDQKNKDLIIATASR